MYGHDPIYSNIYIQLHVKYNTYEMYRKKWKNAHQTILLLGKAVIFIREGRCRVCEMEFFIFTIDAFLMLEIFYWEQ